MVYRWLFLSCIAFANISIGQTNSVNKAHINYIKEVRIVDSNLQIIPYNFCDSNIRKIMVEISFTNNQLPQNAFIDILLEKGKIKKNTLWQTRLKNTATALSIQSESLDIKNYKTGNYNLKVVLATPSKQLDSADIIIQRWNDNVQEAIKPLIDSSILAVNNASEKGIIDIQKTFVANYTATQIVNYLKALGPRASSSEQKNIEALLAGGIDTLNRLFFYNFWQKRNTNNPKLAWQDYAKDLNEAADKYGGAGVPGYATDRGRIFLKYGTPLHVETVSSEQGALPYEVWQYDAIVNTKEICFLFVQAGLLGTQMRLLHSTMPGELNNPYWINTLIKDFSKTDYRVFNYLPAPDALNQNGAR